ncbi:MAG: glutamate-1-semialdehyde 2,1-aminomutase [Bacteriovoracaceae bacterium]|jgi:glutamate-1-semialdehyde 2,1-aminomutase|nr:glutamate-1-semialdehyde 2,1-aminomutase [Bacteriovoracaceae bacterium]
MNNKELFEKSLKLVPGGVHSPVRSFKGLHTTPRFINKAAGAYITDEEGKTFIDFCMSFGPLILGHKNEKVHEAAIKAMELGWSYGACEKYSLELAEYLINKIPFIDQVRFVNSGTEAVMTAIRLARGYTGKSKILKFNGCYHGHTDAMLIKAGSGLAGTSEASSKGISENIANDTIVCDLNNIEQVNAAFDKYAGDIAAIFIEPLPANNGLLIQNKEFLQALRDLCTKHNSLLIFDEVISGFRTGFNGMADDLKITPDMVTYGKIIGGGFPVGAIGAKKDIMECLAPIGDVYQAGTLSANPVAMACGLANLKQLTPDFYQELETISNKTVQTFDDWFSKSEEFNDYKMIQYKSLFWAVPTSDKLQDISAIPSNLADRFYKLFEVLLNKGIYLSPNAYEVGFCSIAHGELVLEDLKTKLWN